MKRDDPRGGGLEWADSFSIDWHDPEALRTLCRVAEEVGLLGGVQVLALATSHSEREFLLTVVVANDVVLASEKFTWDELRPPGGTTGVDAARHILGRLEEIARHTRSGLRAYTWLRVVSELAQVRAILEQAGEGSDFDPSVGGAP